MIFGSSCNPAKPFLECCNTGPVTVSFSSCFKALFYDTVTHNFCPIFNVSSGHIFVKHSSLQFIVFLAIMLHKAPASFGLVTYLLQQNVCRKKIKYSLFVFASAAPVTGILFYAL